MRRGRGLRHHDKAVDRHAFLGADRGVGEDDEARGPHRQRAPDVRFAMGITQRRQEFRAVAGMGLDSEGKQPVRRKHARDRRQDRGKIVHIDEDVGCQDELILARRRDLGGKKFR